MRRVPSRGVTTRLGILAEVLVSSLEEVFEAFEAEESRVEV